MSSYDPENETRYPAGPESNQASLLESIALHFHQNLEANKNLALLHLSQAKVNSPEKYPIVLRGFIESAFQVILNDYSEDKLTVKKACQAIGNLLELDDSFDPSNMQLRPGTRESYFPREYKNVRKAINNAIKSGGGSEHRMVTLLEEIPTKTLETKLGYIDIEFCSAERMIQYINHALYSLYKSELKITEEQEKFFDYDMNVEFRTLSNILEVFFTRFMESLDDDDFYHSVIDELRQIYIKNNWFTSALDMIYANFSTNDNICSLYEAIKKYST